MQCKINSSKKLAKFDEIIYNNVAMRIINLSSGSDGNITYIESEEVKLLLDDGLSCQETVKRLEVIGVKPNELNAILVTHEHSDHIKGIDIFSSKYNIPVYAHEDVWAGLDDKLKKVSALNRKMFDDNFALRDILVSPVEVPHDVKCFGYSFSKGRQKISVVTDLGHITDKIVNSISGSQIVYLEANYDRTMLYNGTKYPLALKRRIDGPNGHLSNNVSAETIERLAGNGSRQIILSHLSKENNSPELAYNFVKDKLMQDGIKEGEDLKVDVATTRIGAFFRLKQ